MEENRLPIPKFWETSFWEPTVQLPIMDYCRPGDIVFDVGANAGALSMLMSRLVGPKGRVCSFEASPRIIDMTMRNLTAAGCNNVSVYYRAVYHTSHEMVTLFPGSHLNDSIYNNVGAEGGATYQVETLALDDFCEATGLVPKLIKMDIEGAEFDALSGMDRLFERAKPILILEQSPEDMRCHGKLIALGYKAVNLADYRIVESVADLAPGAGVVNVLFVHPSAVGHDPYLAAEGLVDVVTLGPEAFEIKDNGDVELKEALTLKPGRYVCFADFAAEGQDNEIFAGIETERGVIHRLHTFTAFMAGSYRDWVFSLRAESRVRPYLRFVAGEDPSLQWHGARICRLPAFDELVPPIVY